MAERLDILAFLEKADTLPVVDVRTPSEFRQGHIPGAHNIPLFSDEERKLVGTTYRKKGREDAVIEGLEYAGPKMKELASRASSLASDGELLVHCWRGGMRSASMAWLFGTVGIRSMTLEGGYKSFRRHVLSSLEDRLPFIVVGGLTGSGKTDLLHSLEKSGEQVIDLEKLAKHKGSAFGSLGQDSQPSNEQFENEIFHEIGILDRKKRIWVEDESRTIGKNTLPAGIYRNIRSAPVVFIDVPLETRIQNLVLDYAVYPKKDLLDAVQKIRPRLGDLAARQAGDAISEDRFGEAVETILRYYDKTYKFGLGRRDPGSVFRVSLEVDLSAGEAVNRVLGFVQQKRIFV